MVTLVLGMFNITLLYIEDRMSLLISMLLSSMMIVSLLIVILLSPGIQVNHYKSDPKDYDPKRFCVVCSVNRKKGTKHCPFCDVCILDKGKHVEAFDKCIGRYTKLPFYAIFICGATIFLVFSYSIVCVALQ